MIDMNSPQEMNWSKLDDEIAANIGSIATTAQLGIIPCLGFLVLFQAEGVSVYIRAFIVLLAAIILIGIWRMFSRLESVKSAVDEGTQYRLHDGRVATFIGWRGSHLEFRFLDQSVGSFRLSELAGNAATGRACVVEDGEVLDDRPYLNDVFVRRAAKLDTSAACLGIGTMSSLASFVFFALARQETGNVEACFWIALSLGIVGSALLTFAAANFVAAYRQMKSELARRSWNIAGTEFQFVCMRFPFGKIEMDDENGEKMWVTRKSDVVAISRI